MKNKGQIVQMILCFVVAVGLLLFLYQYRQAGRLQSLQLEQQAEQISAQENIEQGASRDSSSEDGDVTEDASESDGSDGSNRSNNMSDSNISNGSNANSNSNESNTGRTTR